MNISALHDNLKPIDLKKFFSAKDAKVNSIRILKEGILKEHITPVPALLICLSGEVLFEDKNGTNEILKLGDYINISPNVPHWLKGREDAYLILIN